MIEEFIFAVLNHSAEIADYRTGGVFPQSAPKKSEGWHLTYAQVSQGTIETDVDGIPTRWQINIVPPASSSKDHYRSGKTAARLIQSILEDFNGDANGVCIESIELENQTDARDYSTQRHYVAQDYLIKYFEV